MAWHYKLHVVASAGRLALEVEDPTNEREPLRDFASAAQAGEYAQALCRQLRETGDLSRSTADRVAPLRDSGRRSRVAAWSRAAHQRRWARDRRLTFCRIALNPRSQAVAIALFLVS